NCWHVTLARSSVSCACIVISVIRNKALVRSSRSFTITCIGLQICTRPAARGCCRYSTVKGKGTQSIACGVDKSSVAEPDRRRGERHGDGGRISELGGGLFQMGAGSAQCERARGIRQDGSALA